ncbi:hypothetical protein [Methanobacterium oryzae]|uniref:hypothetical protein n=1 Tax=Methanobacterium oryzae TaxID=69540 RepID=UPI003D1CD964
MRFSVIKYEEDETVYYNPTAFCRDENVIIFPFKEFDNFYNELVQNLNVVKNIVDDGSNPESTTTPIEDLEHIEDWINLIKKDVDLLLKFRMQTTLNSFKKGNSAKIKPPQKVPKVENKLQFHSKEKIQCLIGL